MTAVCINDKVVPPTKREQKKEQRCKLANEVIFFIKKKKKTAFIVGVPKGYRRDSSERTTIRISTVRTKWSVKGSPQALRLIRYFSAYSIFARL